MPDRTAVDFGGFTASVPELATRGAELLNGHDAYLVTVRGDDAPRVHPVAVAVVDGRLVTFILGSAKRIDLEQDGRYALHSKQDAGVLDEFSCRGRVVAIDDPVFRARAASTWTFEPDATFRLFELQLESALLRRRPDADAWPPIYTAWSAATT